MHGFPWYADVFFTALILLTSWQFWVGAAALVTGIVLWRKKKKS